MRYGGAGLGFLPSTNWPALPFHGNLSVLTRPKSSYSRPPPAGTSLGASLRVPPNWATGVTPGLVFQDVRDPEVILPLRPALRGPPNGRTPVTERMSEREGLPARFQRVCPDIAVFPARLTNRGAGDLIFG